MVDAADSPGGDPGASRRYAWLDQARGIVALLFVISTIMGPMGGNMLLGDRLPLGPTYLDHGYNYYKGYPPLITLIDIGQMTFMFVLGFVAYIAFTGRLAKRGPRAAWAYAARRVGALYVLSFIACGLIYRLEGKPINWPEVLYNDIIAELALAALFSYVMSYFVRNAGWRASLAVVAFVVHAFLFASHAVDQYPWFDTPLGRPKFPLGALNLSAIAVMGTAFSQWIRMDPADPRVGFRRRVLPVSVVALGAGYCMEWIQHSDHHDVTTALALISVGLSGLLLASTYAFNEAGLEIPWLEPLGKNLILVFIIGALGINRYVEALPRPFLEAHPYACLLLVGVAPLALVISIAVALDKRNIVIRL
ncbi:MAG: hypothetical protein JXR94_20795 [Candidatus Hydrogenedentes bacterium]|nr:hypothetical protein [Candidatus Hydrogenedentota bacterium]